jgi:hypothetical protein
MQLKVTCNEYYQQFISHTTHISAHKIDNLKFSKSSVG